MIDTDRIAEIRERYANPNGFDGTIYTDVAFLLAEIERDTLTVSWGEAHELIAEARAARIRAENAEAQVNELSTTLHANGEEITALRELVAALEAHHLAYAAYFNERDAPGGRDRLVAASNRLDAARAAFGPEEDDDPWSSEDPELEALKAGTEQLKTWNAALLKGTAAANTTIEEN